MQIVTLLLSGFILFHRYAIPIGVSVVPDAGDLPRHFDVRITRSNHKPVGRDLLGHDGLRELPNHRQLISEIPIERLEVIRQIHRRKAVAIRRDVFRYKRSSCQATRQTSGIDTCLPDQADGRS
jgi:hypothetical protein